MAVDGPECPAGYTRYYCKGKRTYFVVSDDYRVKCELGHGAFGVVCSAEHVPSGALVAVKQIRLLPGEYRPEDRHKHALRALREIRLMRFLKHPNIVRLYDIIRPPDDPATGSPDVDMLYLVMDLMQTDLGSILRPQPPSPPQTLSERHKQHFMYQLLDGVNEMHRRGVMHRDLKPQNILVNSDCTLKICDFGLARETTTDEKFTVYVETRWYRAPELILEWENYDCAVDIWSIGCVFAEMLHSPQHAPLFRGRNQLHQMNLICERFGVPSDEELRPILARLGEGSKVNEYLQRLRREADAGNPPPGLADITQDEAALSLLFEMLQFIPQRRINAAGCLAHRYFKDYSQDDYQDEEEEEDDEDKADPVVDEDGDGAAELPTPVPLTPFDLEIDNRIAGAQLKYEEVRKLLVQEVMYFHTATAAPLLRACVAPATEVDVAPPEQLDPA